MRNASLAILAAAAGTAAVVGIAVGFTSCANQGASDVPSALAPETYVSTDEVGTSNDTDALVQEVVSLLSDDGPDEVDQAVADGFPVTLDLGGVERGLVAAFAGANGTRVTWEVPLGIVDVAKDVLTEWEQVDGLNLCFSGYLDLAEHVWGCVAWSEEGYALLALADERSALDESLGMFDEEEPTSCRLTLAIPEVGGA